MTLKYFLDEGKLLIAFGIPCPRNLIPQGTSGVNSTLHSQKLNSARPRAGRFALPNLHWMKINNKNNNKIKFKIPTAEPLDPLWIPLQRVGET